MASLISFRLYNEDGTPKTGASPKLSAIKESTNELILDGVDTVEVGNGFYKYSFEDYSKSELYFFSVDGEQYDNINNLDSYGNKNTRGRDNSVIINTEQLAKDIRDFKEKDVKKGTIGEYIFSLKNITTEELEIKIDNLFLSSFSKSEEISTSIKEVIKGIKIPKQLNVIEVIKPIEDMINNGLKVYYDSTSKGLETLKTSLIDIISSIEKYDDSESKSEIKNLFDSIQTLSEKIELLSNIETKIDTTNDKSFDIDNSINSINKELNELNRKITIVFTRLNKQ